ncbi:type IV pilus inner membrane component PilO [Vibrio algarum]|uniref:Type 4a pilus biogenesis protein PilO n=1 Tax=Vibrio algarum TaxID=3020714 RepID=A0ABT4YLQ2_9VIBR|nr:type 4a pilus biogenesis protein PilO [Vibrio sp. KJ40-1]MDB1122365.1 type 4a pilus biogenesis protein PilO [Vibrio sp. KJ40-1]
MSSSGEVDQNGHINKLLQLDLEDIVRWPFYSQALLLVLISILVQAVTCWLLVLPKMNQLENIEALNAETEITIALKNKQLEAIPPLIQRIESQSRQLKEFLNTLLLEESLTSLIASITQISKQKNIEIVHIRWGKKEPFSFLDRIPIDIELRGQYRDFIFFSQAITELPNVVILDNFNLKKRQNNSEVLKATITAFTFLHRSKESSNERI